MRRKSIISHKKNDWDMIDDNPQVDGYESNHASQSSESNCDRDSIIPIALSGFTNGFILFVFCCGFSSMLFGWRAHSVLQSEVAIGVGFFTISTFVGGIVFGRASKYPGMIAGPDITPVIFSMELITIVSREICPEPTGGTEPCAGSGPANNSIPLQNASSSLVGHSLTAATHGCEVRCEREALLLPTCLVAMSMGTLFCGLAFMVLGKCRLSGFAGFIPADVVAGFHACIGLKVVIAAVEVATGYPLKIGARYSWSEHLTYMQKNFSAWNYSWRLLLPALLMGASLYLCKRRHWGRPAYMFPAFISIPLCIFYALLAATGTSVNEARELRWLHPIVDEPPFWNHLAELYAGLFNGFIAWDAMPACFGTWASMVLITCLDSLLMLTTTETVIAIDIDYDREVRVAARATLLNSLLGGQPVYSQTKFTQINYAIVHSLRKSHPAYTAGSLCGLLFFSPVTIFNFLPRFVLSGLLVFAACGFLIENLIDARRRFHGLSFAAVWVIFGVNVWQGLFWAIAAGLAWATVSFAIIYARESQINPPISGTDHCSTALRSSAQEMKLGVIGSWYHSA